LRLEAQYKSKIAGLIGLANRAGKLTIGGEATEKALFRNKVQLLIFAVDASTGSINKLDAAVRKYLVPTVNLLSKSELGQILGRDEVAILGVRDESFARGLLKLATEKN
jgi:ribosomal protein L7Ae-like RNA K-turn-binding protein